MSAKRDWDLPVQFYFGNAAVDLEAFLPPEDEEFLTEQLFEKMDTLDSLMERLEQTQENLSYYLRDIMRSI